MRSFTRAPRRTAAMLCALAATSTLVPATAAAASSPSSSFGTYTGSKPLSSYQPGDVLATRALSYHVAGIPTPVTAIEILYRSTNARGEAVANVTTVLKGEKADPNRVVSYQSFYDSMNPADEPSHAIEGDVTLGGLINSAESIYLTPLLTAGDTVVVPDTEGPTADFAAGPEYGMMTLDSMRAVKNASVTGVTSQAKVALTGYSGGAIGSNWAAALAPSYAPDINQQIVGTAEGGLLVDPAHNLNYVSASTIWAGISPMAIAGVGRAYNFDFTPYLNSYGKSVMAKMQNASIVNVLGQYPGITWKKMALPQYQDVMSVPKAPELFNKINLGSQGTPSAPMFVGQGTGGLFVGTNGFQPGIGAGDGVMIAGDVRSLLKQYCSKGNSSISYKEYAGISHSPTFALWAPSALSWIADRFAGKAAPSSCNSIADGNPLTPVPMSVGSLK